MDKISVDQIMALNPCPDYPRARVEKLIGDGLTLVEFCDLQGPSDQDKLWLLFRVMPKVDVVEVLCRIAESVLPIWERRYPGDARLRDCIKATRRLIAEEIRFIAEEISREEWQKYRHAATAYGADAYTASTTTGDSVAAYVAATAYTAAAVAGAAYTAAAAAGAAVFAAAADRKKLVEIIRSYFAGKDGEG